jgi:hypothetical protein
LKPEIYNSSPMGPDLPAIKSITTIQQATSDGAEYKNILHLTQSLKDELEVILKRLSEE